MKHVPPPKKKKDFKKYFRITKIMAIIRLCIITIIVHQLKMLEERLRNFTKS